MDDRGGRRGREVIRYDDGQAEWVSLDKIKPGDTLVAPSDYGGYDASGWAPDSKASVKDIAEEIYEERSIIRRRLTLKRLEDLKLEEESSQLVIDAMCSYRKIVNQLEWGDALESEVEDDLNALQAILQELSLWVDGARITLYLDGVLVSGGRRLIVDEESLLLGQGAVPLDEHLADVGQRARLSCDALGLPPGLASDCELAAALHDIGKADWRFQLVLGGDTLVPLAKSQRGRDELKRVDAGLPHGWRHEIVSAEMLHETDGQDTALVRHLVATHHGYCRPLPPLIDHGEEPLTYAGRTRRCMQTKQWLSQWNMVIQRYGAWGVAYLEAIVRLADWAASREPQAIAEISGGSRNSQRIDLQSAEQMTLI
jgi:CRISPR-associated endonuclease/helicase Cas3